MCMRTNMNPPVLLIVAINLFIFHHFCFCAQVHLDNDEPEFRTQLVDINCKDVSECNHLIEGVVKGVACVEQKCICNDGNNKTTACMPKVSYSVFKHNNKLILAFHFRS